MINSAFNAVTNIINMVLSIISFILSNILQIGVVLLGLYLAKLYINRGKNKLKKQKAETEAKRIMRKVCIPYGEWGEKTDFVLEPVCLECEEDGKECEECKNHIYVVEDKK